MTNIGNPIRCVAQKNNGTQCKCVAMNGYKVCGTHKNWDAFIGSNSNNSLFVFQEDAPYIPKNVRTPVVKRGNISDLFEIVGR